MESLKPILIRLKNNLRPRISVIIPVYKDWDRLLICLNALKTQTVEFQCFEVIVVNNEPLPITPNWENLPFKLQMVHEEFPGSYSARNRAIQTAQGDAFLFTDSDCIPENDWISEAIHLIDNFQASLFAGAIRIFSEIDNVFVRFDKAFAFPNEKYVNEENFGVTANLLVSRAVFSRVGSFNSQMMTGGDSEFCNRAVKSGFLIIYSPTLVVRHPARESWKAITTKAIRFGGRLPRGNSKFLIFLKILGKFRIRFSDHSAIWNLKEVTIKDRVNFSLIKQCLRWIEASESMRVFAGKSPGRK